MGGDHRDGGAGGRCRVLVASVGLSPQVVTETLHALWQGEGWLPDRLVLLATPRSAELARAALLDPATGAIAAWGRDWSVPDAVDLAVTAELVTAATDSGDVDDERAVAALAQGAWRLLAPLAADPTTELHVSIAGGRKPAAAILAILMSVLGRPQDRLSHVLVRPEAAAAAAGLFYPAPSPRQLVSGGTVLDAAAVELTLVDVPFPRLARGAEAAAADGLTEFFDRLSREARPVRLAVDPLHGRLFWDGAPVALPPSLSAFLAWLATEQKAGRPGVPRTGAARSGYLTLYAAFAGTVAAERADTRLADPLDPEWIEEKAARANKAARALGMRPRGARLVQRIGDRARAVYRLALDPEEISVVGAQP
jgi:CRISPR-associated protein (TIGR02584 family)